MDNQQSINAASYGFELCLLKLLLDSKSITPEEFNRISAISAEHYGTNIFCV